MSSPHAPPPLPGAPSPLARVIHAPRVLGAPPGGGGGGPAGRGGGPPLGGGGPMALSQVELRKNLNEALLKRSAKAHHSAPGNIGPLGLPPTQQQGGPGPGVGPGLGGPPQPPVRERGSSTTDVPSYHSPVLSPYQSTSPATSPAGSTPPSPSLPPLLPPRDFPLNPTTTTPTINVNGLAAAAAGASPLRRPPVMLQHAATAHSPMIRSTGSLPLGAIAGGTGSPLRGSAIITNHHTGSDSAVLLTRAQSVVGAAGHRRSVSTDDVEPAGDRRDSGNWIHKRSLSSLVPRLGEMPTDPSLFEKAADAKKMGMKYEKCFTGEMFVEWVQSLGNGHTKQEIAELGEMLIKATLIVVLAGNDTFGTSKYDVYALNELSLGGGMGSSALASAMGSLALNKKEQKKKEKLEKKEEEKRLKEVKKLEKAAKKNTKSLERKKPVKKKANKVFNVSLEEVLAQQQGESAEPELAAKYAGLEVPIALKLLSDRLLELNACRCEGIFRISGTQEEIDKLKAQINELNYDAIAACEDVNVIAGLMKAFLRELPEPLVPGSLYERCITEGLTGPAQANQLLQELPEVNLKIARFVLHFLLRFLVPEHVAVTKMGIENVSMVFAPLFLRNETSDPTRMLLNASYESAYVQNLIQFYLSAQQQQ